MKSIILASNNKDKVKEVKEILKGYDIISMKEAGIDVDIEENGTTFEENALIKARAIMKLTGQITMADDSGLEDRYTSCLSVLVSCLIFKYTVFDIVTSISQHFMLIK